ncbi:MAG: phosphoribosyl-ATP diphosphatase [Myxococcales bacterium]|nr:phosphoribosyl-ATP diphosphatase [Myxococcales bacterium]
MIVPSIDLQGGQAVQLVGGERLAVEAGDPLPIAERFSVVGPVAVIDLDAAMGTGDNAALVEALCRRVRCRVGGGIRSVDTALRWLDAGAEQVILGTAATPELLSQLPRQRVIAALDARGDEVVVEGWRTRTGASVVERMAVLRDHVAGFLVTLVDLEGRLQGTDLSRVEALRPHLGEAALTVAGGITTPEEVAALDAMGMDAQVGMALYTGRMSLGDAVAACLRSDRADGLWPTVVTDAHGVALGLAYSDADTLREAVDTRCGVYRSRKRGRWKKGETSGAVQRLLAVDADCDRDALRFVVAQAPPGFCHLGTHGCFGADAGLPALARRLRERLSAAPERPQAKGSYTHRLLSDPKLLAAKLREEAQELAEAEGSEHVAHEVADVLYFAMVAMVRGGVGLEAVEAELDRRALRVRRRRGDAKEGS